MGFSDVDEYGFKRDENFDYKSYENIMSNYYTVLTNRRMKWQSYLKNPAILHNNKSAKLKRYIRKGIPGMFQQLNFAIWKTHLGVNISRELCLEKPSFIQLIISTRIRVMWNGRCFLFYYIVFEVAYNLLLHTSLTHSDIYPYLWVVSYVYRVHL